MSEIPKNMGYYIIKTKDGEFVKVYATMDSVTYSIPMEFSEYVSNGRRWKPSEVEIVEYPTRYGQCRTYDYIGENITLKK